MSIQKFPSVPPEALIPLVFSFADFLGTATISSIKSVSIAATKSLDATPADRLYNSAIVDADTRAVQWIRYPVLGEVYKVKATVACSDGREWSVTALLPVAEV